MASLKLTLACWDSDRTRPLIDGSVKPEGIDLDIKLLRPRETFRRMLDDQEFHASELSLASYTALIGRGDYFLSNTVLVGPDGPEILTKTPTAVIEK